MNKISEFIFSDLFFIIHYNKFFTFMHQQLIIQIDDSFPFRTLQNEESATTIYARRTIAYSNASEYRQISQKITILKKIKHPNIIPLITVLEEEGKLHLLYDYVPYKFEQRMNNLTEKSIETIKSKIINLFLYLHDKKIDGDFQIRNLGFDKEETLKYYLDITYNIIQKNSEAIKNNFIIQINKNFQAIKMTKTKNKVQINKQVFSEKRKNSFINELKKSNHNDRFEIDMSVNSIPFHFSEKLKENLNSYELLRLKSKKILRESKEHKAKLNTLEQKVELIKQNLRKYANRVSSHSINKKSCLSQKNLIQIESINNIKNQTTAVLSQKKNQQSRMNSSIQKSLNFKDILTSSTQQNFSFVNSDGIKKNRNFSDENHFSKVSGETTSTLKNLQFQPEKNRSKQRYPHTKQDFQQIQKKQFQNFFQSKQTYVHQFLGILDDSNTKRQLENYVVNECQTPKSNAISQLSLRSDLSTLKNNIKQAKDFYDANKSIRFNTQNNLNSNITKQKIKNFGNIERSQSKISMKDQSIIDQNQSKKGISNQKKSKIFLKQSMIVTTQNSQLKNRISKVLEKCDEAIFHFRKQSIYSVNSEFLEK